MTEVLTLTEVMGLWAFGLSSGDTLIATAGVDGFVRVWNLESGALLKGMLVDLRAGHLLSRPEPLAAIVCSNDRLAHGLMRAVRQWGADGGSDVSITGSVRGCCGRLRHLLRALLV